MTSTLWLSTSINWPGLLCQHLCLYLSYDFLCHARPPLCCHVTCSMSITPSSSNRAESPPFRLLRRPFGLLPLTKSFAMLDQSNCNWKGFAMFRKELRCFKSRQNSGTQAVKGEEPPNAKLSWQPKDLQYISSLQPFYRFWSGENSVMSPIPSKASFARPFTKCAEPTSWWFLDATPPRGFWGNGHEATTHQEFSTIMSRIVDQTILVATKDSKGCLCWAWKMVFSKHYQR